MYQSYIDLYGARLSVVHGTTAQGIDLSNSYVCSIIESFQRTAYVRWTHHTRDLKWNSNPTTLIVTPD